MRVGHVYLKNLPDGRFAAYRSLLWPFQGEHSQAASHDHPHAPSLGHAPCSLTPSRPSRAVWIGDGYSSAAERYRYPCAPDGAYQYALHSRQQLSGDWFAIDCSRFISSSNAAAAPTSWQNQGSLVWITVFLPDTGGRWIGAEG